MRETRAQEERTRIGIAAVILTSILAVLAAASCETGTPGLTIEALKNAEYASAIAPGGRARLVNGVYRASAAPGSASEITVTFGPWHDFGDLNGDGVDDAAIVLVSSGGGSGSFCDLLAILNEGGVPRPVASVLLGDRVKVESVTIERGAVAVTTKTHGASDAQCCPTVEATRAWRLQGGELVPEPGTEPPLPAASPVR